MTERDPDLHYAGFWIRAAARVVDLILILAAFNLFWLGDRYGAGAGWWAPSFLGENASASGGGFSAVNVLRGVFFFGFPAFYYVFLHGAYGQTFGKMAMKVRVIGEDGSPLTYRKALLRYLGYFLCDLTLDVGYAWAAFDRRKQGLHDKACRTVVVHEGSRVAVGGSAPPDATGPAPPPGTPPPGA